VRGAAVLRRNAAVALATRWTLDGAAWRLRSRTIRIRWCAATRLGRWPDRVAGRDRDARGRREREADEGVREEIAAALEPFAARAR